MSAPKLDITYNQLPAALYSNTHLSPAPNPKFVWQNNKFANSLGLSKYWASSQDALNFFSGNAEITDYSPLAMAYSGHQFGHFSPQLGDGRALLIGEFVGSDAIRYDIHLKGSGATAYSRRGDGKSTLRAALKEALFSEYLAAIDIPTTRTLAVFTTGERVQREAAHDGAVLVRTAKSLIRVGTFEFANAYQGEQNVKQLADFLIARQFTDIDAQNPTSYPQLFTQIISRQAKLIAHWMSQGFIHGVMNSDNMALSGETIDFGPCAFMERFNPSQVFSSIDKNGRYAWNHQAEMAVWNLSKLATSLLELFDDDQQAAIDIAEDELNKFIPQFLTHFKSQIMQKLGLSLKGQQAVEMMTATFTMLSASKPDYTLFFRYLSDVLQNLNQDNLLNLCQDPQPMHDWLNIWQNHIKNEPLPPKQIAQNMQQINPIYIPRFQAVEQALQDAENGNLKTFNQLLNALQNPFVDATEHEALLVVADNATIDKTFCET